MADLTGKLSGTGTLAGVLSGTGTLQGKISASVIDTTEIAQYNSIYEFPNRGSSGKLYIDMSENASYRWDEAASKYYCVGRDWTEIGAINGGVLNE